MNTAHDIIKHPEGWQARLQDGTTKTFADLGEAIEWTAFGPRETPQPTMTNLDNIILGYN